MDTWPESPNAPTAPPWWAPGFQAISEWVPKKDSKMGPLSKALFAPLTPPWQPWSSRSPPKKDPKRDRKGVQKKSKHRVPNKTWKIRVRYAICYVSAMWGTLKKVSFFEFVGVPKWVPKAGLEKDPSQIRVGMLR